MTEKAVVLGVETSLQGGTEPLPAVEYLSGWSAKYNLLKDHRHYEEEHVAGENKVVGTYEGYCGRCFEALYPGHKGKRKLDHEHSMKFSSWTVEFERGFANKESSQHLLLQMPKDVNSSEESLVAVGGTLGMI